jgi:hypothetical protein
VPLGQVRDLGLGHGRDPCAHGAEGVMAVFNLNALGVPVEHEHEHEHEPQADHGLSANANIEVIFRNHQARLVQEIDRFPVVLGGVAWLADSVVLQALARRTQVNIVVQKEDFLKPDLGQSWAQNLRALYAALPSPLMRYSLPGGVSSLNYAGDPSIVAVRCVGNHKPQRTTTHDRNDLGDVVIHSEAAITERRAAPCPFLRAGVSRLKRHVFARCNVLCLPDAARTRCGAQALIAIKI